MIKKKSFWPMVFGLGLLSASSIAASAGNVVIYGNMTQSQGDSQVGIYSFTPDADMVLTPVKTDDPGLKGVNGAVWHDGKYEIVNMMSHYTYDTWSWEKIHECRLGFPAFMEMAAMAVTYDPTTEKIYGVYTTTAQSYRLAVCDYASATLTEIKDYGEVYLSCMFVDNTGKLFGIRSDGMLVEVDRTSGDFREVGNVGFSPTGYQGAVCDPATGTVYWTAVSGESSALYELDTTDASSTLVAEFPGGEQFTGLYIKSDASGSVDTETPGRVADIRLTFADASLSGTLSFTAPAESGNGTALVGDMDYKVLVGEEAAEVATGTVASGAEVTTAEFTLPASGEYLFSVVMSNVAGTGEAAYKRDYVGYAKPEPVKNAKVTVNGTNMVLSWEAPDVPEGKGYYNAADIRYNVVRYPDGKVIAENLTATEKTESMAGLDLAFYSFGISAVNGDMRSEEAVTEGHRMGDAVSVPFVDEFGREDSLEIYTVVDSNKDNVTWELDSWYKRPVYNAEHAEDYAEDWLFTPAIRMSKDDIYEIAFIVEGNSDLYMQDILVALSDNCETMNLVDGLVDRTVVTKDARELGKVFNVKEDGLYYIGFNTETEAHRGFLSINKIEVRRIGSISGPAAPSDIKAVPGEKGALSADISFTVPSKNGHGESLSAVNGVRILRDGESVHEVANPAPGSTVNFTDSGMEAGMHKYSVCAVSEAGDGYPAQTEIYIGVDVPDTPRAVVLSEFEGKAVLEWEAPVAGIHGGYVDVETLTYSIQRAGGEMVSTGQKGTSFFEEIGDPGQQFDLSYAVVAINEKGTGPIAISNQILVGRPYSLPFEESFKNAECQNYWGVRNSKMGAFMLSDLFSSDGDGGSVLFESGDNTGEAEIFSGRIDVSEADHLCLKAIAALNRGQVTLNIGVYMPDGKKLTEAVYNLEKAGVAGRLEVNLDKYVGSEYVQLFFSVKGKIVGTQLFLDEIRLADEEAAGVDEVLAEVDERAFGGRGEIRIVVGQDKSVKVFTLDGRCIVSDTVSGMETIPAEQGVYIVAVGEKTFKVIVR